MPLTVKSKIEFKRHGVSRNIPSKEDLKTVIEMLVKQMLELESTDLKRKVSKSLKPIKNYY